MDHNKRTININVFILVCLALMSNGLNAINSLNNNEGSKTDVQIVTPKKISSSELKIQRNLKTKLVKSPRQSRISGQKNLPKEVKNLNSPNDAQVQAAIERFKKKKAASELGEKKQPSPPLVRK
ncbi:MAG: hypothetical protein KBD78_03080 [Oligoflexales bacterium]|nr:hypothetical protein [Oligoflexales bacterium]